MSLVKLLTAGKSLVGGQDVTSRYKMNKQMRLPKFVSPRNPFATEGKPEVAPAPLLKPAQIMPAAEETKTNPASADEVLSGPSRKSPFNLPAFPSIGRGKSCFMPAARSRRTNWQRSRKKARRWRRCIL